MSRSVEPARRRGVALLGVLAAAVGCGAAVGVAGAVGAALQDAPAPAAAPQVTVSAPAVTVAAPPIVVAPVREPAPPAPEPPPPPPPPPRATTPFLNGDCYATDENDDEPASESCRWDNGLPAVSADGARVAMFLEEGPGNGDYFSVSVRVLDVRTSRVVRDLIIRTAAETYEIVEGEGDGAAVRARVKRRAAAVQRFLDAGGYRTLDPIGHVDWSGEQHDLDRTKVHAEIAEDFVRAIDPANGRALWQHRFSVPRPDGNRDPDGECSGFRFHGSSVWWDPTTRVVLVTQHYATGGCMCSVFDYQHVKRMR